MVVRIRPVVAMASTGVSVPIWVVSQPMWRAPMGPEPLVDRLTCSRICGMKVANKR